MNWTVVQRILGLLLMMFSVTMLPPILISLIYDELSWLPFLQGFGLTLAVGVLLWLPVHKSKRDLRLRDGFLIVAAFWTVFGTAGAAPLLFCRVIPASIHRVPCRDDAKYPSARSFPIRSTAIGWWVGSPT